MTDHLTVNVNIKDGMLGINLWEYIEELLTDINITEEEPPEDERAESVLAAKHSLLKDFAYHGIKLLLNDPQERSSAFCNRALGDARTLLFNSDDAPTIFRDVARYWLEKIRDAEQDRKEAEQRQYAAEHAFYELRQWCERNIPGEKWPHIAPVAYTPGQPVMESHIDAALVAGTALPDTQNVKLLSMQSDWRKSDEENQADLQAQIDAALAEGWRVMATTKRYSSDTSGCLVLVKNG